MVTKGLMPSGLASRESGLVTAAMMMAVSTETPKSPPR